MSAYNYRMFDAIMAELYQAVTDHLENLGNDRNADYGELKYRQGLVAGIRTAIEIAEETRKKQIKD